MVVTRDADRDFDGLSRRLLEARWSFYPTMASRHGLHQYDGLLPDLSWGAIRARVRELLNGLNDLASVDPASLSPPQRLDRVLLELTLEKEHFDLAELRAFESDPMRHLGFLNVTNYVQRDYAPLTERAQSLTALLSQVPDFLNASLGTLGRDVGRPVLDMSIESFSGMAGFYRHDLQPMAGEVQDSGLRKDLDEARERAAAAIDRFVSAIRGRRERASEEFAIGGDLYQKMLRHGEMVDLPMSTLIEVGEADLERNLRKFTEAAARLDPSAHPRAVAETIAADHPTADRVIPETAAILGGLRRFIQERDILSIPSDEECLVKETPSFMRWAFAAMDSPGPLEARAADSFYYVTPVDPTWTEEQKEEWLRGFDRNTLKIVSIHEVYPGHFTHALHVRSVASAAAKSLRFYSFTEGWAHYCEQMMVEEGYGEHEPSLELAQARDALLRNCRYLCSIGMHTQGMSVDEATRFFVDKAYMGEFPARKEVLRGTFDHGYLNYTLGKLMILKLRDDWRREQESSFSPKRFHDTLLSFGSPPVPALRDVMLRDPGRSLL